MKARVARQSGFDCGMLVSRVVVSDQVHCEPGGNLLVEVMEKADELLVPVARFALRDYRAVEHVERANRVVVPCW